MIGDAPRIRIGPWRVPALAPAIAASLALHAALALAVHVYLSSRTPPDPPRVAYSAGEPVRVFLRERTAGPRNASDAHRLEAAEPEPLPPDHARAQAAPPRLEAAPARTPIRAARAHAHAEPSQPASAPAPDARTDVSAARRKLDLPSPAANAPASADQPAGLTHAARVVHRPQPRYPDRAVRLGYEGAAEVEVAVLASGEVASVTLRSSSGRRILDEAALQAAERGAYEPARVNGRPVNARVVIPFTFTLREQYRNQRRR